MGKPRKIFNGERLALLLRELEADKNVERVLEELFRLRIPIDIAQKFNVVGHIYRFSKNPKYHSLVASIPGSFKKMIERKSPAKDVKFAVPELPKQRVPAKPASSVQPAEAAQPKRRYTMKHGEIVIITYDSSARPLKRYGYAPFSIETAPAPTIPSFRRRHQFDHNPKSPFYIVHGIYSNPLAPTNKSTSSSPVLSEFDKKILAKDPKDLKGLEYFHYLSLKVMMETKSITEIDDPTLDQVWDEMNMVAYPGSYLKFRS